MAYFTGFQYLLHYGNEDIIDGVDNDGDGEQGGRVDEYGRALFDGIDNDGDGIIDEGIDSDFNALP